MAVYIAFPTDEQEKALLAFLDSSDIYFVKDDDDDELPPHVLAGIAWGQADFKAGRYVAFEEFKKRYPH